MKKAIRCICFIAIFVLLFAFLSSVFSFKYADGNYSMTKFYEQDKDTIDVIVIGSSHAFEDVNTAILWEDYGIAAYDLCSSMQPMWNSYYYLVEALKTQSPRLIILEGYTLSHDSNYADDSRIIKNTYGIKWSRNRLEAVKASTPGDQYWDYLIPTSQQHGRYNNITAEDFRINQGNAFYDNWKGFLNNTETQVLDEPDVSHVTERVPLSEKNESYYRQFIELAQEHHIPVAVIVSPYAAINDKEQAQYNYASDIAAEYGVHFYNFNLKYQELGLDFATDMAEGSHLNMRGNAKYSKALGEIIRQDYPNSYVDRRGDDRYSSWQLDSEYYDRTMHNLQIENTDRLVDAIALANEENYIILLSISGLDHQAQVGNEFYKALQQMGIDLGHDYGVWQIRGNHFTDIIKAGDFPYHLEPLKYQDILVTASDGQVDGLDWTTYQFMLNDEDYTSSVDGVNLLIYDTVTASIVKTMTY